MVSKRFTNYIILANVAMCLFVFLSSQYLLTLLKNHVIGTANILTIDHFPYGNGTPIPTIVAPAPNFPFYVFFLALMVNIFLLIIIRRSKE